MFHFSLPADERILTICADTPGSLFVQLSEADAARVRTIARKFLEGQASSAFSGELVWLCKTLYCSRLQQVKEYALSLHIHILSALLIAAIGNLEILATILSSARRLLELVNQTVVIGSIEGQTWREHLQCAPATVADQIRFVRTESGVLEAIYQVLVREETALLTIPEANDSAGNRLERLRRFHALIKDVIQLSMFSSQALPLHRGGASLN